MPTAFHAKYFAHELTRQRPAAGLDRLSHALFDACVDLNPHQIEAAHFALRSPLSRGAILADEVGLGKTIEAGLVLCQFWAERKRRLVVTVDRHMRTPEDVLRALFREERDVPHSPRPEPRFKELVGRFGRTDRWGEQEISVSGSQETFTWIAERLGQRHRPGQPVIRLMDGQPTLWETAEEFLPQGPAEQTVEILDIVHVAGSVWRAAQVFESAREHREAFSSGPG